MKIVIIGAGRAGSALHRALRRAGASVTLRPLRRGLPKRGLSADLIVLAVRDSALSPLAKKLARQRTVVARAVVLHIAGAVDVEVLSPLREHVAAIGSAHPLLSFASSDHDPNLRGALLLLRGDPAAKRAGRRLARTLGARALDGEEVDARSYHAAAALLANGAVALADFASDLLVRSGIPEEHTAPALGALLVSVSQNIEIIGISGALTGPVVRGDAATVCGHLDVVGSDPELLTLYRLLARRQLAIASRGSGGGGPSKAKLTALLAGGKKPSGRKLSAASSRRKNS